MHATRFGTRSARLRMCNTLGESTLHAPQGCNWRLRFLRRFSKERIPMRALHGCADRCDRGIVPTRRNPLRSGAFSSIISNGYEWERRGGNRSAPGRCRNVRRRIPSARERDYTKRCNEDWRAQKRRKARTSAPATPWPRRSQRALARGGERTTHLRRPPQAAGSRGSGFRAAWPTAPRPSARPCTRSTRARRAARRRRPRRRRRRASSGDSFSSQVDHPVEDGPEGHDEIPEDLRRRQLVLGQPAALQAVPRVNEDGERRDRVERVQADDQVEEAPEGARGEREPLRHEAHPLDALEDDEEGSEQHREEQRPAGGGAVAEEGALRQEERDAARDEDAGVERGRLERKPRLSGRRPDRRAGAHDREGGEQPREEHQVREDEDRHPHHGVRHERGALGLGCEAEAPGTSGGGHPAFLPRDLDSRGAGLWGRRAQCAGACSEGSEACPGGAAWAVPATQVGFTHCLPSFLITSGAVPAKKRNMKTTTVSTR